MFDENFEVIKNEINYEFFDNNYIIKTNSVKKEISLIIIKFNEF